MLVVLLCACGRIGFHGDATSRRDDARNDSIGALDAPRFFLDAGECPPGYTFSGSTCYRWVAETIVLTWLESELLCEQDAEGAHLVIVADATEATAIDDLVVAQDHWIGSTDRATEAAYTNVTGTATTYLQWPSGYPIGAAADCLGLDVAGQVIDRACDELHTYVCEYDGQPAEPASY